MDEAMILLRTKRGSISMLHLFTLGVAAVLAALSGVIWAGVFYQDVAKLVPMAYSYGWVFVACALGLLFIFYWRHTEKKLKELTLKIDELYDRIIEEVKTLSSKKP